MKSSFGSLWIMLICFLLSFVFADFNMLSVQIETEKLLAQLVETEMNKRLVSSFCGFICSCSLAARLVLMQQAMVLSVRNFLFYFCRRKAPTKERSSMQSVTFLATKLGVQCLRSLTAIMPM
jgi:hypothetical protein